MLFASRSACNMAVCFSPDSLYLSNVVSNASTRATTLSYCACSSRYSLPNRVVSFFNASTSLVRTLYFVSNSAAFPSPVRARLLYDSNSSLHCFSRSSNSLYFLEGTHAVRASIKSAEKRILLFIVLFFTNFRSYPTRFLKGRENLLTTDIG